MNSIISIVLKKKIKKVERESSLKIHGPVGACIDISERGDVYIKGICISCNIPDTYLNWYEISNEYLIGKPTTIILQESHHINQFIQSCFSVYKPIEHDDFFLVKSIPPYIQLSIDVAIPRLPKNGLSLSNSYNSKSNSEILFDLLPQSSLYVTHLSSFPTLVTLHK